MDALNLTFARNSFDHAWTQHVAMNIPDRKKLYSNIHRVLKRGGRFATYDVTAGDNGPLVFPVPWARTHEISFLLTEQEMRAALRAAGFAVISSKNQTTLGIEWFEEQQARIAGKSQPALGLHLVIGPEFPVMAANRAPQPEGRTRWACPDDRGEGRPLSAVAPHPSVFELQQYMRPFGLELHRTVRTFGRQSKAN